MTLNVASGSSTSLKNMEENVYMRQFVIQGNKIRGGMFTLTANIEDLQPEQIGGKIPRDHLS